MFQLLQKTAQQAFENLTCRNEDFSLHTSLYRNEQSSFLKVSEAENCPVVYEQVSSVFKKRQELMSWDAAQQ